MSSLPRNSNSCVSVGGIDVICELLQSPNHQSAVVKAQPLQIGQLHRLRLKASLFNRRGILLICTKCSLDQKPIMRHWWKVDDLKTLVYNLKIKVNLLIKCVASFFCINFLSVRPQYGNGPFAVRTFFHYKRLNTTFELRILDWYKDW